QTSYSGLAYNPNEPRPEERPQLLNESGKVVRSMKRSKSSAEKRNEITQMDAVLKRIADVCKEHGMAHSKPLWLPEMPSQIYLGDMQCYADQMVRNGVYYNPSEGVSFLLGMADDTITQRYLPCMVNLTELRNLLLVGIAGTGKTTAIQSMVTSLCSRYDPAHMNIYILSLTSQTLKNLKEFPHVGDVLFEEDVVEMQRFINMMFDESQRRGKLFAQAATDSFVEYNRGMAQKGEPVVPAIVVFMDRFEQLKNTFANNDFYTNRIHTLIREGSSRGIHFVATALAKNEIPGKLHPFFGGIPLQLRERSDYTDVLGKRVPPETPPIAAFPGRGMALIGEDKAIFEIQIGLGGIMPESFARPEPFEAKSMGDYAIDTRLSVREGLNDVERADSIVRFATKLRADWKGALPMPVPRVPEKPTFEAFAKLPEFKSLLTTNYSLPVGYDMNSGTLACIELESNYSMLVTGTRKSGITNQLMVIARVLRMRGVELHVIAGSNWRTLCTEIGASLHQTEDEIAVYMDRFVIDVPAKRQPLKKQAEALGKSQMRKQALQFSPYAIIVDNAEILTKGFNAERFTKSPVELVNASQKAHDDAVKMNEGLAKTAAEYAAKGEEPPTDTTPVQVPEVKTAAELAPGQNPQRNVNAKTYINNILMQLASTAEFYNTFLFMGVPQSEKPCLNQEPLKTLAAQGRGIALGGHLTDYDPIGISQAVSNWPSQARAKGLPAGNGYLLTTAGMVNIRVPLLEAEEND
ncbi:MAG: FtsK/SpoIIIE domain-containing protein, partial [bacterium]